LVEQCNLGDACADRRCARSRRSAQVLDLERRKLPLTDTRAAQPRRIDTVQ